MLDEQTGECFSENLRGELDTTGKYEQGTYRVRTGYGERNLRLSMRIPIWSYDANPAVDPWLLKRSLARCEGDVLLDASLPD
jgi:hypothetical protein